jgi:hypothetical protein
VHQWEEATSGTLVAYNFGYPDQRPERQYFLFKKYIFPRYHPKYVVYGLGAGDANSNIHGMHPDHPKTGPFWSYRNIVALDANSVFEKAASWLEEHSVLYRSRRRARFELQHGPIAMLPEEPTIGGGILAPTVRHQAFGPMELSWGRKPLGLPHNDYHNYWIPDNGEIGQLVKLNDFCKKNGVELVIVEFPTSPYSHTNFDDPVENYGRFLNALDYLESKGARVLRMGQDLKLDNTYYEDQAHMNRWGAQAVTDYVYQHVIREWFPDTATAPALPSPQQIIIADVISSSTQMADADSSMTAAVAVKQLEPATADAQYGAMRQVVVTQPEDFTLTASLAPGSYSVELYAGDGTTTSPEITGAAKLELAAVNGASDTIMQMPLTWINTRLGISYTQAWITVKEPARLELRIVEIGERPVILDTAFIRRRLSDLGTGVVAD